MNLKPHLTLLALAILCITAVAWAADAPGTAPAPPSHGSGVAPAMHGDASPVVLELEAEDGDELGLGAFDMEDGPGGGGAGGERRVIVRRFRSGGDGGEGAEGCGAACGAMCGGKAAGMGAHRMGMGMGMGMGRGPAMFAHMTQALDLSDAQRAKLADIHERQMRRDIQARADQQIARLDLRKAMTAEKPDAGAINTQIDRVAKLRTDMAKARVAALLEARALLTPEQQKQMREMHMQPPGAGRPGMGHGMGMGPGGMRGRGMGRGGPPMRVKVEVERDTLIRR